MEKPFRLLHDRKKRNTAASGGFPENRHIIRISSKASDILLYPLKRTDVIQKAEVAALPERLAPLDRGEVHKAHETDPVIDRHEDDILLGFGKILAIIDRIGGTAPSVRTAGEKYHDRLSFRRSVVICPNIQRQAVLSLRIGGCLFCLSLRLDRTLSIIVGFIDSVISFRKDRSLPPQLSDGRFGVGNSPVRAHAVFFLSHIRPVMACDREGAVIIRSFNFPVLSICCLNLLSHVV